MSEEIKNKKRNRRYDRITLYEEALKRVDSWIDQAEAAKAGVKIHRKDFLNWFVLNAPETLTVASLTALADKFFDQEKFLREALKKAKAAKERGETLSLKDLLNKDEPMRDKKILKPRTARKSVQPDSAPMPDGQVNDISSNQ